MTSYRDMKAQITKLEKQATELFKKEVADAISTIKRLMNDYGLSISDLGKGNRGRTAKVASKKAGTAKYRDPVSGKTWTGHGKAPGWLTSAVAAGKSRDKFLISAPTAAASKAPATKAAAKATRKARTVDKAVIKTPKATVTKTPAKPAVKPTAKTKATVKPAAKAPAKKSRATPAAKPAKAKPAPKAPRTTAPSDAAATD